MSPVKLVLMLVPFVWSIGCIPFVNKVKPFVFGFPLLAFWMIAGVFVVFVCIAALYHIDTRGDKTL